MKPRSDAHGLFWDTPPPVPKKVTAPPERIWERPDYLPNLEEARRLPVSQFTLPELIAAQQAKEILVCDTEVYMNYFLVAFMSLTSGKVIFFETRANTKDDDFTTCIPRLRWILESFQIVTFNGKDFDLPILALALHGCTPDQIKHAANQIIQQQLKPWMVLRPYKVKVPQSNHIDLIEVAPLQASLKIYGGRLHVPKMQDLPFDPELTLTEDQIAIVRWYCIGSDLVVTAFLYCHLRPQIELRTSMSVKYGVDLRSKSDAQIAEAVLCKELHRLTMVEPQRVEIAPGTVFRYKLPSYVAFETPTLQNVVTTIVGAEFVIGEDGSPIKPPELKDLTFTVGVATYRMGIGGLHSCEERQTIYANEEFILQDVDIASNYPTIILNQRLFPKHIGEVFLTVYKTIVDRRLAAKKSGNKVEADSLKITINGGFGKFGSPYSVLYAPDLMLQVTLSGQLSLLMLIERLELVGIRVCSANTDGVLIRCPKHLIATMEHVVTQWEKEVDFVAERTSYSAVLSRDINNYIAIKKDSTVKVKGDFAERGSTGDSVLSKNPVNLICRDALIAYLTTGKPIAATIAECKDVRRFLSVRTVKGGAVKDGAYLGKAIRWYQSTQVEGEIIYASNGNKVPNSERCRPCLELPKTLPLDIDFARYEAQTLELLREVGYC